MTASTGTRKRSTVTRARTVADVADVTGQRIRAVRVWHQDGTNRVVIFKEGEGVFATTYRPAGERRWKFTGKAKTFRPEWSKRAAVDDMMRLAGAPDGWRYCPLPR